MTTCAAHPRSLRPQDDTVFADARTSATLLGHLALREAVVQIDRRRERPRAHDRAAAWQSLVTGRWSIVDQFERDGRRYYLARRNEPLDVQSRALSPREHVIAHLVASGTPNKVIAYSLGLATSTIASHLAAAMKKLGLLSRLELVTILTALRPTGDKATNGSSEHVDVFEPDLGTPSHVVISIATGPALADTLSPAEREVVQDVLAGLANSEIASKRERSARTIANQLASIFRKLGVGSRFELTARLVASR